MATQDDYNWLYGTAREGESTHEAVTRADLPRLENPLGAPEQPPTPTVVPAPAPAPRPMQRYDGPLPEDDDLGFLPGGGSKAPRPPRRRRKRWPWVLAIILALVTALLVYLVSVPLGAWNKIEKVDDTPAGERPANQPGTTILMVGTDKRGGLTKEEAEKYVAADTANTGSRTDSMMLLHVPQRGKPVLISLPRDSYVAIPGHKKQKLNAAYAIGGAPLLIQTVEANTGVRVDGYVEVGFGGFARVVDALGGIDVCVEKAVPAYNTLPAIQPGCQHLDTRSALWFVRNRNAGEGQDLGRMKRQRQFMNAAIKGMASPSTVTNPARYTATADAFSQALGVGKSTEMGTMLTAAQGMQKISKGEGYSIMVPIASANARTKAGSAVLWDTAACKELFGMLAKGDTTGVEKFVKK